MLAASMNRAFGQAGLLLAFVAAVAGAASTVYAVRTRNVRLLGQSPRYVHLALGGVVVAVVMMQRALIGRDWSLAYVQQVGSADPAEWSNNEVLSTQQVPSPLYAAELASEGAAEATAEATEEGM